MPVDDLAALARTFGDDAPARKLALLGEIREEARLSARDLLMLHDTLCFLRAYPDTPAVRTAAEELAASLRDRAGDRADDLADTGFPGSHQIHAYSYGNLVQLVDRMPGALEIEWDAFEDHAPLHNALVLVLAPGEVQGLDDITLSFPDWVTGAKPAHLTDLEFILGLFTRSRLTYDVRAYVYDSCGIPVVYRGPGRCELSAGVKRVSYQRRPVSRDRTPLRAVIRRPLSIRRGGRGLLDLSLAALACRSLEIPPLIYANPDDIRVAECGRGLEIVLIGTVAEQRDPLESSYFVLFLQNGVPIAYGPASVCLGCSEQGVNLFPEFRGSGMRHIIGQYYRVLHHVLGARSFFLTRYAMGEGNPAAIRTGAFWFYRKMGFRALVPRVEALAQEEEARMQVQPGYRSDARTLRRLSHTEAVFDLSGGECPRLDFGAIGLRQSRLVADRFDGDRARAEKSWTRRAASDLGIGDLRAWTAGEKRALRILAPLFCMLDGLRAWPARDRAALVRLVKAKGGRSEIRCDRMMQRHARLRAELSKLGGPRPGVANGSDP